MYPILIQIGSIPIHTYGFLIAVGFLFAVYVAKKNARRAGLNVDQVADLAFWVLIVGFLGARFLFVLTRLDYFLENPLAVFKVWEGGLVFLGGPLAAVPFGFWYLKKHKMPLWKTVDVMIPGLPLGHMFGRFGCLSAGCCYGKPTGSEYGVQLYSELVDPALRGIHLHPTQLYEASALLVIFLGLMWTLKRKSFDGQVFLTYFMTYPIARSIIEEFRGDTIRGFVIEGVLSTSQFISILIFIAAAITLVYRLKKTNQKS